MEWSIRKYGLSEIPRKSQISGRCWQISRPDFRSPSLEVDRGGFGSMKIVRAFALTLPTPIARWAPIPLRLIVGYGFMERGYAKLSKGPDAFAGILQAMGVPSPHFMAWSTILVELCGGFAVILGAFVAIVSVPMAAVLLVALFKVDLPYGFSSIKLMAVTAAGAPFWPPVH